MKLLVVGSKKLKDRDYEDFKGIIDRETLNTEHPQIVTGGTTAVNSYVRHYCKEKEITFTILKKEDVYKREVVENVDKVIIFNDKRSKSIKEMIQLTRQTKTFLLLIS